MTFRVLHLIPTLGYGGAERQLALLAAAQLGSGHDVHVGVLRGGPNHARLADAGVEVHTLRARGHHDPLLALSAMRLVRRLRPDIVHTWLPLMDVVGSFVKAVTGIRWVLAERSTLAAYGRLKDRALRLPLGRFADAVVANSEGGRALWTARTRRPVRMIRNVVPLEEIAAAPRADLARIGLPSGAKAILFAGRLSPEKNIQLLLGALMSVLPRAGAVALICGSGPLLPLVETAASQSGGTIRYLGERKDVWELMKAASLLVAPSTFEGNPTVVLEAAACGCPLVVSDISAHRDILPQDAAFFTALARPGDLAAVIESALAAPAEAERRARRARAVLGAWSMTEALAAYDMTYSSVLEGGA